ncbi:WEB family protein At1g12150-like [Lycium ferocissimum]|uniref:WEB family protein At1g12150-like n=1 Tax=Lycium ferocissimum TaxID=112874 RepID=UPI00281688DC|nr:WEB family protein At1g12150-like [Lycium ferocissimum]
MGEIDTKSIESVQAALSLFGEKSSDVKKKYRSTSCINMEMEKEKDIGSVLKYLANLKIELEAKDSAHKQALLKLDHNENTVDELYTLLMSSELEKEIYTIECRALRIHVLELESRIQKMDDRFLESVMTRGQLSHAIDELKATQRELVGERDAKLEALTQVEVMEKSLSKEKLKTDELLRNVSKLNETVLHLRMTASEAEESTALLYERKAELELEAANAKEEIEFMSHHFEIMQNLENELLNKSALIDSMKAEFQEVNELCSSYEKVTSDAASEVKKLNEALELQERKNWDQSGYTSLLELELRQVKGELNKANEQAARANADVETIKKEMVETREKESEAQVEIAFLKSELHKGRSKIVAAEVADSLSNSEKSALHLAVQQLALEAEEAKKENKRLKEASKSSEESRNEESEEGNGEAKAYVTVPREEYERVLENEQLIKNKEPVHEEPSEIQVLKKELKTATVKISELRTRAEQAISRAEAAEKGKAALENQIKRWKEHKERKKAALAALREESISREITEYKSDTSPKTLQPLGKVLRMNF